MRKSIRFVRFGHILAGGAALALMVAACSPAAVTPTTGALATEFPTTSLSTSAVTSEATTVGTSAATSVATSEATSVGTSEATAVGTSAVGTQALTPNATSAGTQTANNAPLLIESDKLLGMSVMDNSGAPVGSIVDVLVNTTGTVQAVVLNLSAAGTPSANATGVATTSATEVATGAATTSATEVGTAAATSAATEAATVAPTEAATAASTAAATEAATAASTSAATAVGTAVPTGAASTSVASTPASSTQTAANMNTVAVPWTDITADPTTQHLTYNGGMSSLAAMTPFDESSISSGYVIRSESSGVPSNYNGLIRLGGDLKDLDVQTPANDKLGDVQHVIIDMQSGMATYAVVDFGGFLGIGTESVLVPWNKFQLDNTDTTTTKPVMRLNVTKDSLQSAPKFDESKLSLWPTPANQGWDSQIQLFWQTAAS
jgi:sporulation protein YlmC with PRC-barrel domain